MTSAGCWAIAAAAGLEAHISSASAVRSALELSVGGALKIGASLAVFALLWWPFVLAAVVGAWLFFEKAGRHGWACLVPGYNAVEFLRIAKLPGWLAALFLVPAVNVALFAWACARVARAFRQGPRFAVGLALLPPVYAAQLGLGAARYRRFDVLEGLRAASAAASAPEGPAARRVFGRTVGGGAPGAGALHVVSGGASGSEDVK